MMDNSKISDYKMNDDGSNDILILHSSFKGMPPQNIKSKYKKPNLKAFHKRLTQRDGNSYKSNPGKCSTSTFLSNVVCSEDTTITILLFVILALITLNILTYYGYFLISIEFFEDEEMFMNEELYHNYTSEMVPDYEIHRGGLKLMIPTDNVCNILFILRNLSNVAGISYKVEKNKLTVSNFFLDSETYTKKGNKKISNLSFSRYPITSYLGSKLLIIHSSITSKSHHIIEFNNEDKTWKVVSIGDTLLSSIQGDKFETTGSCATIYDKIIYISGVFTSNYNNKVVFLNLRNKKNFVNNWSFGTDLKRRALFSACTVAQIGKDDVFISSGSFMNPDFLQIITTKELRRNSNSWILKKMTKSRISYPLLGIYGNVVHVMGSQNLKNNTVHYSIDRYTISEQNLNISFTEFTECDFE